jgi:hypothetical protein
MVKINPADNPKFDGPVTVAGSSPDDTGTMKTEGELEEMIETYNEIDEKPTLTQAQVEPLLPDYAWFENDQLKASPPGWAQNFALSEQRKDILQYRAGGHSRTTIEEIVGCSTSAVHNACRVFSFLLHNETVEEWDNHTDAADLLLKTVVGPERKHPEYSTEDEEDGYECEGCGATWDSQSALAGHRGNCDEADTDYPDPDEDTTDSPEDTITPDELEERNETRDTTSVKAGAETVSAKVSHDEVSDTEPTVEADSDVLCVSEVMSKGQWRETVQTLLNSEEPGSDAQAERLMSVLTEWPDE